MEMVVALQIWVLLLIPGSFQALVISENMTCNPDDLGGLAGFANGLESPIHGWPSTSSSLSCCNLEGITCDTSSGRIVKLELASKRLTGNLSTLISNIDQLKTINLSHNFLFGPLPISLFHLRHLEVVDLSGNNFNGVLPVSINLPALQVLDVSDNLIRGFLPSGLCVNSTRVRDLRFSVNYFEGVIPVELSNCAFLERIYLASNFHTGDIPKFLFELPRLQELALEDNKFTTITGMANSFSRLVRLDVSSNRLSGNIPDVFHNFPNLSYFSAQSNYLSGAIPPSLSNSPSISSLNLRNNSLDGSVDFNCSMMVNLTSLDLGTNNFSGTIPSNLASCRKLKAINLARNKLTGQIPESFKNFESLSYLSLSNCSFSNLQASLRILQRCPNLTVLILTRNFFAEQLPSDDDLQFKSLKALVVADCMLKGSIPLWINNLTHLQLLDLSWNDLTGTIPAYFGNFKSLFYLDLSNNSLSGEIPKNLTQLESLISRDVTFEESSPYFPFVKMSNEGSRLQYNHITRFPPLIDLSSNQLTGPICPEFGSLKRLHVLDLKHNILSGQIPGSLSGMRSIETLDMSYNNLTGTIPASLVKLNFLSKFSVAYNNLTGIIPSGGQLSTFTNSSFEGNPGLCGDYFVKCTENQDSLQTPTSEDNEVYTVRLLASTGFGTGFLVTVISWLVIIPARNRGRH